MNLSPAEVIAAMGLIINAGALIWGAATLAAAVKNLSELVAELKKIQETVSNQVHGLVARIAVLEDRAGIRTLTDRE